MLYDKILVAVDGSKYSQAAADYGFWLSKELNASIDAQNVVDPRMVDLILEPEFGIALGFGRSIESMDTVMDALRKMGQLILNLFGEQAASQGLKTDVFLDEGYIVDEILKRAERYDLLIMGHRGRGARHLPQESIIGSIAERVVVGAKKPVLVAVENLNSIKQILVAYDGSEPSIGALLMSESLCKATGLSLKALSVAVTDDHLQEAKMMIEQARGYLREHWPGDVFETAVGQPAPIMLEKAANSNSLLVLGSYGFRNPDSVVMGSTATHVIRRTKQSVLIYR